MQERIKQIPTKLWNFGIIYRSAEDDHYKCDLCCSSRDRTYNVFCIPTDLGKI